MKWPSAATTASVPDLNLLKAFTWCPCRETPSPPWSFRWFTHFLLCYQCSLMSSELIIFFQVCTARSPETNMALVTSYWFIFAWICLFYTSANIWVGFQQNINKKYDFQCISDALKLLRKYRCHPVSLVSGHFKKKPRWFAIKLQEVESIFSCARFPVT
jgi:hypothetical protein